jgi:hypothetical protein
MSMYRKLLLGLTSACGVALQAADVHEIMSHSFKLTEANWFEAPNYSYTRSEVISEGRSQPFRRTYEVLMIEGSPYLKKTAEGGKELSAAAAHEEEQRFQREMAKRRDESPRERRKRMQKYAEERNRAHAFLTELAAGFEYSITGERQSEKRKFWVLEGKPKSGYSPSTREGRVLLGMHVKFWIDKATSQWLRLEAEVEQPVSIYGPIAKLNPGSRLILEQEPVSANLWLPSRFTMQVNATALGLVRKDVIHDETYTNYRFVGPVVDAARPHSRLRRAVFSNGWAL